MIVFHVEDLLYDRKMNQIDLVRLTSMNPTQVAKWYHGTLKRIPLEQLDEICRVLNEPVGRVLEYVPDHQ